MRVYICRHAEAAAGEPDELRELTPAGEEQATRLAANLAAAVEPPAIVLSSPLVRARQTAEMIARVTGAELRLDDRLRPGATVADLRASVHDIAGPVATVGHQPDCSEILAALTREERGFPPGGFAPVQLEP